MTDHLLALSHSRSEQRLADARLAQSAKRKALNLVVVGSSPTVGVLADSQLSVVPLHRRRHRTNACCSELRPCRVADAPPGFWHAILMPRGACTLQLPGPYESMLLQQHGSGC